MRPVGRGVAAVEEISVSPSVSAYCRQARRLRGTLARQPVRMHRKLRELAVRPSPVAHADGCVGSRASRSEPSKAKAFAGRVAAGLDGPVLRYATRRTLVAEAGRLGIGRFEANLIIAAVQHERRGTASVDAAPPDRAGQERPRQNGVDRFRPLAPVVLVIAVEVLLALGLWQVCWG